MSAQYLVDQALFDALHPFSFLVNASGQIALIGRSLPKLFSDVRIGVHYSEFFNLITPAGAGVNQDLASLKGELVVLALPGSAEPRVRGQLVEIAAPERGFMFSLHPAITDTKRLAELKLDFSDFELAAPLFDFFLVMRSSEIANEKLKKANFSLSHDLGMSRLLREVITAIYRADRPDQVYRYALDLVRSELRWELAHVEYERGSHYEHPATDIWSVADEKRFERFIELRKSLIEGGHSDIAARAIENRGVVWIADYSPQRGYPISAALPVEDRAVAVGVPIFIDNEIVAVLEFISARPQPYSDNSKEFFDLLSSQIALALRRVEAIRIERDQLAALAHASKMATLGQIVAGVAHEINNPVSTISLVSQILKRASTTGGISADLVSGQVGKIDACVGRIAQIVRELRVFSRDSSKDPFKEESLRKIIDETIDLCHSCMSAQGVRLKLSEIPAEWLVPCRASQLSQVFMNLINNAYHAVEGCAEKWVEVTATEKEAHYEVAITDSGRGISAGIRDKIMTPFFTTKPAGKGTGLGLSISANIMVDHEGRLLLDESSPHTRFVVVIPKRRSSVG
jgi:signal transduction histidine kinase